VQLANKLIDVNLNGANLREVSILNECN